MVTTFKKQQKFSCSVNGDGRGEDSESKTRQARDTDVKAGELGATLLFQETGGWGVG